MGYKEYFPGVTDKKNANEIFERIFKRTEKLNIKVLGNRRQITCKIPKKNSFPKDCRENYQIHTGGKSAAG